MSCSVCEGVRRFLPAPIADRLRALERARAKEADRKFKRAARAPLPGETTNRVLDPARSYDAQGREFFGDQRWREKMERGP